MTFQEQLPSHYLHTQCMFPTGKVEPPISNFYLKKKKTTWENRTWKHFVTHFMHYLPQNENTKVLWIHSNPDYKSDCKNLGLLLYILCGYAGRILIEVSAFLILMQIWFYFFLWLWGFFKFRYQSFKDPSEHLLVSTWSQTYFWNM